MQLEQIVVDLAGNKIVKQVQQELTSIAATLQIHINYDQGSKMIADTLRLIILRANKAFTDQEALMEASGYLSFARHRRHHQTLLSIIDIMIKDADADNKHVVFCTLDLFVEALSSHERLEDSTFARFLSTIHIH